MTLARRVFSCLLNTLGEPLLICSLVGEYELTESVLGELLGVPLPGNLGGGDRHDGSVLFKRGFEGEVGSKYTG